MRKKMSRNEENEKISVQICLWKPKYYKYLYRKLLEEIRKSKEINVPKWEKDFLIILLERAEEATAIHNKKKIRKVLEKDLSPIIDENVKFWEGD